MARTPKEKQYLVDKRNEFIWALAGQDYSGADIAKIFHINRSTVQTIVKKKPANWKTKWIKK